MASRNYAQVAPTAATIALNAYIYGYGGHSLVTPHAALKRLWWTDERIDAKVTRAFVISKLRGEEREFLDRPLAFGEGLTDDTYMEWILERAKRFFLILAEVGVPDQIFGCIDDSWDDDDLPLPLEDVKNLELSFENDPALNKRFYDMQFVYLLRELKRGAHIDYGPKEHIPMEHVQTLPPAVTLQIYDRVHFPNRPDDVFLRRKYPFTDRETGQSHKEEFTRDVRKAKALSHQHIATAWGSYTSENCGYILSDFVPEHTLATFIDHRNPMQLVRVKAPDRPVLLLEWMHCLSDALASLHSRGLAHTQIRPSNIWIDHENNIAFADVGCLPTFQRFKKHPKTEAYDYAAPEQNITKTPHKFKASSPPVSSMGAFSKLRKMSTHTLSDTSSSSSGSSGGSSTRSNSICTTSPITPASTTGRSNSLTTIKTNFTHITNADPRSPASIRNFSRLACPSPSIPTGPLSPAESSLDLSTIFNQPPNSARIPSRPIPAAAPSASDIFSLACVFLDILTFILKGKLGDFVKFRSTKTSVPGKKMAKLDTSFHSEPEKIAAWIDQLEDDSYRHPEEVFRGIPEILRLIRQMMAQNASLRPTALEVRDRLHKIFTEDCGIESLCCTDRIWPAINKDDLKDEVEFRSPFRRGTTDELSIATGLMQTATFKERPMSASPPRGAESFMGAGLERTESQVTLGSRRSSTASTATARLSTWRSKFMRSG